MREKSFRYYHVIETADLTAEELQKQLNACVDDMREMQIDYVVGTKIIMGFESFLNATGRANARNMAAVDRLNGLELGS